MKSDEWYNKVEGDAPQIDNLVQIGTKNLLIKGIQFDCQVYRDVVTNEYVIWGSTGKEEGEHILSFRLEPDYVEQQSVAVDEFWKEVTDNIEHDLISTT